MNPSKDKLQSAPVLVNWEILKNKTKLLDVQPIYLTWNIIVRTKAKSFTKEGILGNEGFSSSTSTSPSPNDDVMETPEGDTPGDKAEKEERGDEGGDRGDPTLSMGCRSREELLS